MIVRPPPPADVTAAFRSTVPLFLAGPNFGPGVNISQQSHLGGIPVVPTLGGFGAPGPVDHDSQQVFKLGLRDLKAGAGTPAAKSAGWRCFAGTAAANTVLGYCSLNAANAWELTWVSSGNQASSALQASQGLDHHAGVPAATLYELRFLTIPAILVDAFWLSNMAGGRDLAIVYPAPPGQLHAQLNARSVYEMPAFLAIAATLATTRLNYFDHLGY
jgi:hypothetical protein